MEGLDLGVVASESSIGSGSGVRCTIERGRNFRPLLQLLVLVNPTTEKANAYVQSGDTFTNKRVAEKCIPDTTP